MTLQFRKQVDKPNTLTCIREDGSSTWTQIHPGIEMHDFAHFAVEVELGFSDAFYGMVRKGFDIADFERPREQRPVELLPANLSVHALQTEHIVNLLQVSEGAEEDLDLINELKEILKKDDLGFPSELNEHSLHRIRERLSALLIRWESLSEGQILELTFDY